MATLRSLRILQACSNGHPHVPQPNPLTGCGAADPFPLCSVTYGPNSSYYTGPSASLVVTELPKNYFNQSISPQQNYFVFAFSFDAPFQPLYNWAFRFGIDAIHA